MQRSFSSSAADHQNNSRSSVPTYRHLPDRLVYNNRNDYYSSDTNLHNTEYLRRVSSNSSLSSTSSAGNPAYRILPVRYSSVDRIISKPPQVTTNEHGINVRIEFDPPNVPRRRRRRHRQQQENRTEKHEEHYLRRHTTKEEQRQQFGSCPTLNKMSGNTNPLHPSNITYIETRSIVRDESNDRLPTSKDQSQMSHSTMSSTKIRHIPLENQLISTPVISRVIREEE